MRAIATLCSGFVAACAFICVAASPGPAAGAGGSGGGGGGNIGGGMAIGTFGIQGFRAPTPQLGGSGLFSGSSSSLAPPAGPLGSTAAGPGTPRSVPPESFPGIANNPGSTGTQGGAPGNSSGKSQ
jgi:hypothetical protein